MMLAKYRAPCDRVFLGGWRWTCHSPTGSDPEGSSPNEPRLGSTSSLLLFAPWRLVTMSGHTSLTFKCSGKTRVNVQERCGRRLWTKVKPTVPPPQAAPTPRAAPAPRTPIACLRENIVQAHLMTSLAKSRWYRPSPMLSNWAALHRPIC